MYATAAARSDGLLLLCGGRDVHGTPLADAYGFARHRDGRWEWHAAPGSMPSGRYQHGSVFVGTRLHISGGAVGGGRMVSSSTGRSGNMQHGIGRQFEQFGVFKVFCKSSSSMAMGHVRHTMEPEVAVQQCRLGVSKTGWAGYLTALLLLLLLLCRLTRTPAQ
jgi:hypothetical protein